MQLTLLLLLGLIALLAGFVLVLYLAGRRLPREHRSVLRTTLPAGRATVWAALTDYAALPQWWPAVKAVRFERLPDGTELTWNTDRRGREVAFRTGEARRNEKLVRIITGENLPFGGTWTFELADALGGGTALILTEDGFIDPPLFRAVATWFLRLDATQQDFVAHLEKHLAAKR